MDAEGREARALTDIGVRGHFLLFTKDGRHVIFRGAKPQRTLRVPAPRGLSTHPFHAALVSGVFPFAVGMRVGALAEEHLDDTELAALRRLYHSPQRRHWCGASLARQPTRRPAGANEGWLSLERAPVDQNVHGLGALAVDRVFTRKHWPSRAAA